MEGDRKMSVRRRTIVFTDTMKLSITAHDSEGNDYQPARSLLCFSYSDDNEEVMVYVDYKRAKELAEGLLEEAEGMKYKG